LVTEGNGHTIDPAGDARRALQEVVAEHGPEALSNAVIMDDICQARLSNLPGEAILIGSAARTDVPAMLRDLIPRLGNYGAIQSAAATLAEAHGLDTAACVWVVREFARALGLIASGATQPAGRVGPGGGTSQGAAPPSRAGGPPASAASPAAATGGGGAGAGGIGGGAGVPGGPGIPPGMPGGAGGQPPRRPSSGSRVLNRNTIGIAAAIALVAGYLGVAAAAHLSPFPAKTVAATSSTSASASTSPNQGNDTNPSPDGSPDPAPDPDPSPTSDYQILLSKIPTAVRDTGKCYNYGTQVGAIAVSECTGLHGLAAGTIFYYLFSDSAGLSNGFSTFLSNEKFTRQSECASNNNFVSFIAECESNFTNASPNVTGSIAEYANKESDPIIVSSDNQQQVMAVMVGTNDGDLLAYWKQLQWVVT
jgi:hypothetical protein